MDVIWLDDLFSTPHIEKGKPNFVAIVIECDSKAALGVIHKGLRNVPTLIVGRIEFRNYPEALVDLLGQIETSGENLSHDVLDQIDELLLDWEVWRGYAWEGLVPLRRMDEVGYLVWENSD